MSLPADQLVAHRGWPARHPENSLSGVRAALATGARHVEIDIQLSRDGVPVVFHDAELERLTEAEGRLADYDFADLPLLRAERVEPIPRLADVAAVIAAEPDATLFVEVKPAALHSHGVKTLMRQLAADLPERFLHQFVIISSEIGVLAEIRRAFGVRIGAVTASWDAERVRAITILQADYLFVDAAVAPPQPLPETMSCVYTVNDVASAEEWLARGYALVETDRIGEFLNAAE